MAPGGGGLLLIHAFAHSMPGLSRHIGSLPGLMGLSGIQVNGPLPSRSTRILPCSSMAMMVASLATAFGAADMALAIISASVLGALCLGWAAAGPARAAAATNAASAKVPRIGCPPVPWDGAGLGRPPAGPATGPGRE